MKLRLWLIALLFAACLCGPSNAAAPEFFWICYGDQGAKYVMQIDPQGNVILKPTRLSEAGSFHLAMDMALSFHGKDALDLWYVTTTPDWIRAPIYRLLFTRKTLRTLYVTKTSLQSLPERLTLTHQSANRRIGINLQRDGGVLNKQVQLVAYPIGQDGRVTGKGWFLSPPLAKGCGVQVCNGGIGGGGEFAYWFNEHPRPYPYSPFVDIFIRPLGQFGHPVGQPVLLDHIEPIGLGLSYFTSADTTSTLAGNRAFVVYVKAHPVNWVENGHKILLQVVNGSTGRKLGEPILLHSANNILGHTKIDPLGRFIIFSLDADVEPGIGGLFYLALDKTGHRVGHLVPLVRTTRVSGIGGYDLLRD